MPTYEYECGGCGHHFEKFQTMSAKPLKTCPKCGQEVRRLIGPGAGLILKGGGSGGAACSLERTGTTCCGRSSRCETPACGT